MESSIMDPEEALGGGCRDEMEVVVEGSTSPIHHHHQSTTMALMDGVTVTITSSGSTNTNTSSNNNSTTNNNIHEEEEEDEQENDDKCCADKDGSDLRAIDFASATNHHSEPQPSVLGYDDDDDDDAAAAVAAAAADTATVADDDNDDDDNDGHGGMMLVDSLEAAEAVAADIAMNSSSSSSNSSSSSSSSSSNISSSDSSISSSDAATGAPSHLETKEDDGVEEEEEDVGDVHGAPVEEQQVEQEEQEEEDQDQDQLQQELTDVAPGECVDETTGDKIMHTDDDPLLQETINALMNGTGGLEVMSSSINGVSGSAVSTAIAAAVAAVAAEMNGERNQQSTNSEELETDRNYECTYCGKLFTRSNTLSYHLKVHTGERPFKCKHCSKAFREQYRLMKHLKTHSKYRQRRMEWAPESQARVLASGGRERLQRKAALAHASVGTKGLAGPAAEEDCATGDSERFFKNYELPDETTAMKLEPDISLTEEGMAEVPDASALLTEEVEVMEPDVQLPIELDETTEVGQPSATLTDANDIRHQIIEERIKSLQREVHLVNQNLNRVESKVDGLTRIISLLIEKFEDDGDPASSGNRTVSLSQTTPPEEGSVVPVTSLAQVTQQQQQPVAPSTPVPVPSPAGPLQSKALLITSSAGVQQTPTVYTHVATVGQSATLVPLKDSSRAGNTHFYQFAEPPAVKPTTLATTVTLKPSSSPTSPAPAAAPTPASASASAPAQTQQLTGVNGNQLLDTFPEIPELPIRTVSDFLDLNDHCTDNEQFLLQMMIRLHQEIHNSQPFQRNIKRMMEALVTYEVLCQFSWSGKSAINGQYTKYVFGNSLGIIDLLTKTLNLGKSAAEADANQKPIFAAIQSFIKHSRQNMIRDSRKRREPMLRGGSWSGPGTTDAGSGMSADGGATISFHLNGSDQFQTKLIKSEHHHHHQYHEQQQHQAEMANPF